MNDKELDEAAKKYNDAYEDYDTVENIFKAGASYGEAKGIKRAARFLFDHPDTKENTAFEYAARELEKEAKRLGILPEATEGKEE